ncbi:MAG: ATP-binding protein [Isosphaeraceae bacterium]
MIRTLRTKLLLGITPLLAIMVGLGLWAVVMFSRLGGRIDVILRENYRSVLAAEGMKEALERIDSALLFVLSGEEARGRAQFAEFRPVFDRHFKAEQNNITLPGEGDLVARLDGLQKSYFARAEEFLALGPERREERPRLYYSALLPLFHGIKRDADAIQLSNQRNMEDERDEASGVASVSTRLMILGLLGAAVLGTAISLALSRSILEPIRAVTRGARAMAAGDHDQVVPVVSGDELGELAAAFNSMARTIREFHEAGTARLVRAQMTAQATIDSFPDPVVVVDPTGAVERSNPAARRLLGVTTGDEPLPWAPPPPVLPSLASVLNGGPDATTAGLENSLCLRDHGQEKFYLPRVLAIRDRRDHLLGAAVVLTDVTKFRLVDQLKSDMVSTVSHELKTPLTGLQMAIHLLLEEAVGPLSAKQTELLLAARQDSDRLLAMINDLLDLTRIEQGRVALDLQPVRPAELLSSAVSRFESQARDAGVELAARPCFGLPDVMVDVERVGHVFDNLVGNALAHTPRGGAVTLSAEEADGFVRFDVTDTGTGITAEHLPRLFDKFYRVPGSRRAEGAGLGLAITREIVTAHGGEVEVHSEPGHGSTFGFTLTTAKPAPTGPDQEPTT